MGRYVANNYNRDHNINHQVADYKHIKIVKIGRQKCNRKLSNMLPMILLRVMSVYPLGNYVSHLEAFRLT